MPRIYVTLVSICRGSSAVKQIIGPQWVYIDYLLRHSIYHLSFCHTQVCGWARRHLPPIPGPQAPHEPSFGHTRVQTPTSTAVLILHCIFVFISMACAAPSPSPVSQAALQRCCGRQSKHCPQLPSHACLQFRLRSPGGLWGRRHSAETQWSVWC